MAFWRVTFRDGRWERVEAGNMREALVKVEKDLQEQRNKLAKKLDATDSPVKTVERLC